jgi:hypothetical protein
MPKIQQYVAQVSPQGAGGTLSTPAAFGTPSSAAGEGLMRLGDFLQQKAERDAAWGIQKDMAKVRGDWTQRVLELEQNVESGAPDFTKKVLTEYDAAMEKMRGDRNLPTHLAERLAMEQDQVRTSLMTRAMSFEAQEKARKKRVDAMEYGAQASRNAFLDPAAAQTEIDRLPEAIAALGLTGAAADEARRVAATDIAENTVRGLIERGHLDLARQAIKEGPVSQFISGDQAARLTNQIQGEQRRLEAEAERKRREAIQDARSQVSLAFSDTLTSIELTGKDPGLINERTIRAAFPDNPGQADRLVGQLKNAREYYAVRQGVALTTPEEDQRTLNALASRVGGVNAAQTGTQLRDYERAIADKQKALREDPVAYLLQNSPDLAAKFAAGANDPKVFRQAVAQADQMQASLGVPTWRRTYLGKNAAAQMSASIQAATPEKAANELENMAQRYGDLWPNVLNELAGSGLNASYAVLGRLSAPTDAVTRVNLTQALQTPADALKKGMPETEVNDIKARIDSDLQDFRLTFGHTGSAGRQIVAQETDAATKLALFYRGQGLSASESARRATKELITDRFDFEGTYRTPKGLGSDATRATQTVLDGLRPEDLRPLASGNPNVSDDYRRQATLAEARRGIWVNKSQDKGLMLIYRDGTPVYRNDGTRIEFDFNNMPKDNPVPADMLGLVP